MKLDVNLTKTNTLHVRNPRKLQSKFPSLFDMRPVSYCKFYKYLATNIKMSFCVLDFIFTLEKHGDDTIRVSYAHFIIPLSNILVCDKLVRFSTC